MRIPNHVCLIVLGFLLTEGCGGGSRETNALPTIGPAISIGPQEKPFVDHEIDTQAMDSDTYLAALTRRTGTATERGAHYRVFFRPRTGPGSSFAAAGIFWDYYLNHSDGTLIAFSRRFVD
jgi:hypothetical protein